MTNEITKNEKYRRELGWLNGSQHLSFSKNCALAFRSRRSPLRCLDESKLCSISKQTRLRLKIEIGGWKKNQFLERLRTLVRQVITKRVFFCSDSCKMLQFSLNQSGNHAFSNKLKSSSWRFCLARGRNVFTLSENTFCQEKLWREISEQKDCPFLDWSINLRNKSIKKKYWAYYRI